MTQQPVAGVDYPADHAQFLTWFPDEAACLDYLLRLRWPNGFVCADCGPAEFYRPRSGLWVCKPCTRPWSVTSHTMFHNTRVDVRLWFVLMWMVLETTAPVPVTRVRDELGLTYLTAGSWLRKLRAGMAPLPTELLGGLVEVDDTQVTGVLPDRYGSRTEHIPLFVAAQSAGEEGPTRPTAEVGEVGEDASDAGDGPRIGPVRVRFHPPLRSTGGPALRAFAAQWCAPGTQVVTDGAKFLRGLGELELKHGYSFAPHRPDTYSALPQVHEAAEALTQWLRVDQRYEVQERLLPSYLGEFTFRYENRDADTALLWYRLMLKAIGTPPRTNPTLAPPTSMLTVATGGPVLPEKVVRIKRRRRRKPQPIDPSPTPGLPPEEPAPR